MGYYIIKKKNPWNAKFLKPFTPLSALESGLEENERYYLKGRSKKGITYDNFFIDECRFLEEFEDYVEWDEQLDPFQLRIFIRWLGYAIDDKKSGNVLEAMKKNPLELLKIFRKKFLEKTDSFINLQRGIKK